MMMGLRPILSDQAPNRIKNGVPITSDKAIMIGGCAIYLEGLGQEEQRVELAGVPHHGLAGGQADQGQNHDLQVLPLTEGLGQGLGGLAPRPSSSEAGDSFMLKRMYTDTASNRMDTMNGTRQPQSTNAASPMAVRVPRITISDRNRPSVAVVWIQEV